MFKKLHIQSISEYSNYQNPLWFGQGLRKQTDTLDLLQNSWTLLSELELWWTTIPFFFLINISSGQDILDLDLFLYQDKSSHSVISTFDLYSQNQVSLFYLIALGLIKFIIFPPYFYIKIKPKRIDIGNKTAQLMIWSVKTQVYENCQNLHYK